MGDLSYERAWAYGGMRFNTGSSTPLPGTVDIAPRKITDYDEELPLGGDPLNMSFDQPNSDVVVGDDQGGIYSGSLFINFEGEQGELYTINVYINGAPAGLPLYERVSQADNVVSTQQSSILKLNGNDRWSVWVNADKDNTDFNLFGTSLFFYRVSERLNGSDTVTF